MLRANYRYRRRNAIQRLKFSVLWHPQVRLGVVRGTVPILGCFKMGTVPEPRQKGQSPFSETAPKMGTVPNVPDTPKRTWGCHEEFCGTAQIPCQSGLPILPNPRENNSQLFSTPLSKPGHGQPRTYGNASGKNPEFLRKKVENHPSMGARVFSRAPGVRNAWRPSLAPPRMRPTPVR